MKLIAKILAYPFLVIGAALTAVGFALMEIARRFLDLFEPEEDV